MEVKWLVAACVALLVACAVGVQDATSIGGGDGDIQILDPDMPVVLGEGLGGQQQPEAAEDTQTPPDTIHSSGEVAAQNQGLADKAAGDKAAADGAEAVNGSATPTTPIVLPPAIIGGTEGAFAFKVVTHEPQPADSEAAADAGKGVIGEAMHQTSATKQIPADQIPVDKIFTSLFDLKPLFMGIQADIHRRRALLGGVCVMSLKDIVSQGICKDGHRTSDGCSMYAVPPMSIAMQTLFNNAKTNFCKFNSAECDASFCYTYGGPVSDGQLESSYHVMNDYPIWVHLGSLSSESNSTSSESNSTSKTNATSEKFGNATAEPPLPIDKVVIQKISFKISLEKVVFCEKLDPKQDNTGHVRVSNCYTSRRCKMLSLEHKGCEEGSSDTDPAPAIDCPKDVSFIAAVQAKEGGLASTLCSSL